MRRMSLSKAAGGEVLWTGWTRSRETGPPAAAPPRFENLGYPFLVAGFGLQ